MSLRKRIEAQVKQMIDEGGFDPNTDAVALAIRLISDPMVVEDIRVTYLVPEIKRVAKQQIKPGVREVGGRIQTVASLRAEIEQEAADSDLISPPVQQPIAFKVADLMRMTKVQVMAMRDDYEQRALRTMSSAIEQAAVSRMLNTISVRMGDLDTVGDVLTEDGVRQLAMTSLDIQRNAGKAIS